MLQGEKSYSKSGNMQAPLMERCRTIFSPRNCCRTSLLFWLDGKRKQMPFAVTMVRRELSDHVTDCYFCMTAIRGFSRNSKSKISYLVCKSAIKPVSHSPDLPVPQPPTEKKILCPLMHVRLPVLKVKRNLLNWIPLFNMSLRHSSLIRNV